MSTANVSVITNNALQPIGSSERQSAAAATAFASTSSYSRWIFSHEQLMKVPSIREGMTPEELHYSLRESEIQELKRRRVAANTIHQMADKLNHESRVRISQLCICAAMMHMHRFFVFHSFFKFDPRDIAAACLFLAGKSEECPRKLDHVVRVWWAIKFPYSQHIDQSRLHDASQLIVTLENLVLQTIAFDLSVDIPHPYVLTHMQKFARDASGNRRISEIAYWFASDMLHMTNWGVRYTAKSIACVCIQMACLWAEFEVSNVGDLFLPHHAMLDQKSLVDCLDWLLLTVQLRIVQEVTCGKCTMAFQGVQFQIQTTPDEVPWFKQVDSMMTLDKLLSSSSKSFNFSELTEEFSHIYKTYGESLNIRKYAMRSSQRENGTPQNPNQLQQQSSSQQSHLQHQGQNLLVPSIATLPPPPVAPQLNTFNGGKSTEPARRIDISDYKLRNSGAQHQPGSSQNLPQTQRRNFMRPDVPLQNVSRGLELPLLPIIANEKQQNQNRDQVISKPGECSKVPKPSTPKSNAQKSSSAGNVKPLLSVKQLGGSDLEKHKRIKTDDHEKDIRFKRMEKGNSEASHHRKRTHENVIVGQPESSSSSTTTSLNNITPKAVTPKSSEHLNSSAFSNHVISGSSSISRLRDETSQSLKRDNCGNNRSREEGTIRQRDDTVISKKSRQVAPLNALLPTPQPQSTGSLMTGNSQNSKYSSLPVLQSNRANHIGESTHRTSAASNWTVTNEFYSNCMSSVSSRLSQPSESSNHRHYMSSNTVRTKSREPLLSTPDPGSSYYKRSRARPSSPSTATTSSMYRSSQRLSSPGNRSGSGYSSNGFHYKKGNCFEALLHYLGC
ncbi:unnamed protein product [Thelazia callipaeda]|uniref:Cyclin N-terminal domain-containing protein n=1 Tax=Thelazia callipaeda TaxID=103827 RepID=A0A0N5D9D0_THECL|nr:unnamed protein product [Thelazia callipaeda]